MLNNRIMDLSTIKNYLKMLPLWLRISILALLGVCVAFALNSCANTKAVVRTSAESTQSSITITTNNPTNVTVTNRQDTLGLNFNPNK